METSLDTLTEAELGELVEQVPFNSWIGLKAGKTSSTCAEMVLSVGPQHLNHVGTVQGAAQYALAESTSGLILLGAFPDLAREVILLSTAAEVVYRRPAVGDLRARATLSPEEAARVRQDLSGSPKTRVRVPVEVLDSHNEVVMTVSVEWLLRRVT